MEINLKKNVYTHTHTHTHMQGMWVRSLGWKDSLGREWLPTPIFLPGEFHGQRSLAGYSPWRSQKTRLSD